MGVMKLLDVLFPVMVRDMSERVTMDRIELMILCWRGKYGRSEERGRTLLLLNRVGCRGMY